MLLFWFKLALRRGFDAIICWHKKSLGECFSAFGVTTMADKPHWILFLTYHCIMVNFTGVTVDQYPVECEISNWQPGIITGTLRSILATIIGDVTTVLHRRCLGSMWLDFVAIQWECLMFDGNDPNWETIKNNGLIVLPLVLPSNNNIEPWNQAIRNRIKSGIWG